MKHTFLFILLCSVFFVSCKNEPKLRVACVGDSITSGYLLENIDRDNYPSVLGRLLGKDYKVKNFGIAQRTLLNKGDYPYMSEKIYQESKDYNPNIVIIMLGTNDTSPINMAHIDNFDEDLTTLVKSYRALPNNPSIYLCLSPHPYGVFSSRDSILTEQIFPRIREVAQKTNSTLIDLYEPTSNQGLFIDGIHPNKEGAEIIANTIYKTIK